ncbi:GNAT family N-acetyltransferase, partial [Chloroflexota bacterium]
RAITYNSLITGEHGEELDLSFVAEVDNQVIGFILARHAYFGESAVEVGMIQILGVDLDYRRRGIATQLIDAFMAKCKAGGLNTVRAMINMNDSQLKGLFTHMHFRQGQLIDYVRDL